MSLLSLELPSPTHLPTPAAREEDSPSSMPAPLISPSSDRRFWSNLRTRVDTLLETRNPDIPINDGIGGVNRSRRMKEDSMLLIRGFDSIAYSLTQLNGTIDNALQGARDLAKAPTLTEIVQSSINNGGKVEDDESENGGKKRKLCEQNGETAEEEDVKEHPSETNLKKVKSLAVSMAAKSAFLARELKSVKSDMCFMRERCALLEEENRRLRNKFGEEIEPDEEDDLVRLQLEALLGEKSRLASENANLTRENQCLRELVEYHQFASQDLSSSYEQVVQGLCLDFDQDLDGGGFGDPETPKTMASFEFPSSELDERIDKEIE